MTTSDADPQLLEPISLSGVPANELGEWLSTMMLIREFELACDPLSLAAKIVGAIHSSAGQEAVAVGSVRALSNIDVLAGSHRSHHHALARGLSARGVMAELFGRTTGVSEGRGGTMHLRDVARGYLGGNGIVGAGVGIAMGAALAASVLKRDQVALGFVGDGGMNTGRTWEFVNLAVVWRLPLIVICENNLYAVETLSQNFTGGDSIARRAAGFGITVEEVDGQDVAAVYRATSRARVRAVGGEGPTFIEARTYRYQGHNTGQAMSYRSRDEVDRWRATRDPIERLRRAMVSAALISESDAEQLLLDVRGAVEDAVAFAQDAPLPDPKDAARDVTGLPLRLEGNP